MKSMMQLTRADLDKFQIAQDAPYCGVDCRGQDREAPYALYVLEANAFWYRAYAWSQNAAEERATVLSDGQKPMVVKVIGPDYVTYYRFGREVSA